MTDLDRPPVGPMVAYSDVVSVFEPNEKVRPPLNEYLRDMWDRRQFMLAMAHAELKGSRAGTFLGEIWNVIDPMFQAALYFGLITVLRRGSGSSAMPTSEAFSRIAMMVGCLFLFSLLQNCVAEGGRSIIRAKGLMLNVTFPRGLVPLSAVYRNLRTFLPCIPVYIALHLFLRQPVGISIALVPLLFLILVAMGVGFAMLFATLTVYVLDTTNILSYVLRILFFVTPILYPVESLSPAIRNVLQFGPFFGLFAAFQAIIAGTNPRPIDILLSLAWATFALVVGYRLFVSHERSFALRL